jgi:hypothetical protein
MKFFISLLAIALLSFISGVYLPWWSFAVAAFLVGSLMTQRAIWSFLSGFLGVFLLWLGLTLWIDVQNEGILSARMALILPVDGNVAWLHLLTAALGGLVAGFASLTGRLFRRVFPEPTH